MWKEINQPGGGASVTEGLPYTIGELRYSVREEMACTLGDLLIRRTHVAFDTRDHGVAAAERSATALSALLGWDDAARLDAIRAYSTEAARMFSVD